jgi:pimeloyl-ACP methyl ester carboxylesterase
MKSIKSLNRLHWLLSACARIVRRVIVHERASVNGVQLHYVTAGCGDDAIVLLHGWPETSYAWRHLMPLLEPDHRVVAPDLRGLGDSARTDGGYDKRTIAKDVVELLDLLGIDVAKVVGHDMGAAVAYALAAAYSDRVSHLAILEMLLPGFGLEEAAAIIQVGTTFWHVPFNMARDVPEALTYGREREYLYRFYKASPYDPSVLSESDIEEYLRCYRAPGAMRAGFEWYRALTTDVRDNRLSARTPLKIPVLALGGQHRMGDRVRASCTQVAEDVEGVVWERCGHYPHEGTSRASRRPAAGPFR